MNTSPPPDAAARHSPGRLLAFALETHPPLLYALVCTGWSISLLGCFTRSTHGAAWPSPAGLLSVVFFLILLYLRALDEIKDLPYDRAHHPDRPLVRGAVSTPEVVALAAAVAAGVLSLSAWLSTALAMWVAGQLLYGLGLLALERRWARFRNSIMLNLCITFPVSAALNGGALLFWMSQQSAAAVVRLPTMAAIVATHIAIFLHMELGRKLTWPHTTPAGEHSYSTALGVPAAAGACAGLGLIACGLASWVHLQWGAGAWAALPWLAMLPAALGFMRYAQDRHRSAARALKPWFGGAMVLFFWLNATLTLWA